MIISELFTHTNYAYRGSDDDAPVAGTPDWNMWLAVANRKISEYVKDGKQARKSLFETRSPGVVSSTQTYDLDDDVLLPANDVKVITTTNTFPYVLCEPQEAGRFIRSCYIAGHDPQVLTFVDAIPTEIIGGTLQIAGFWVPADLTSASDTIPVDDPYWLAYSLAAELSFNDLTYSAKYPELVAKANSLYKQMSSNNRRGTNRRPRSVPTSVDRIQGTSQTIIGSV